MSKNDDLLTASRVIEYLNEQSGKNFSPKASGNTNKVVKLLEDGYSEADCKQVVDNMVSNWGKDPKMSAYLRPATLFNNGEGKRQFESYLNMTVKKPSSSSQDDELNELMGL